MKIAIVDDEVRELEKMLMMIEKLLPEEGFSTHIDTFPSGEKFLERWQPETYDIIILDIFMDKILGIDVARKIRELDKEVKLIFCTTSNEFACESYEVNANYYLHKPYSEQSVRTMLDKINLAQYELGKHITLPDGQNVILRNIVYTEYYNHSITFFLKRGEPMQSRLSQTELETILSEYSYFFSPTKGVVVNFHEVQNAEKDLLIMTSGATVPVSKRKVKETETAYTKFHFERTRKEMRN